MDQFLRMQKHPCAYKPQFKLKTDPRTDIGVVGLFFLRGGNQSLISTLTRFPHSAEAALMTVRMALAMRP